MVFLLSAATAVVVAGVVVVSAAVVDVVRNVLHAHFINGDVILRFGGYKSPKILRIFLRILVKFQ